jgi:hypothetical protein
MATVRHRNVAAYGHPDDILTTLIALCGLPFPPRLQGCTGVGMVEGRKSSRIGLHALAPAAFPFPLRGAHLPHSREVSRINRSRCNASPEGLAHISRSRSDALQPNLHTTLGAADRNRTRNLLFTKQLLCQLSYGGVCEKQRSRTLEGVPWGRREAWVTGPPVFTTRLGCRCARRYVLTRNRAYLNHLTEIFR